MRNGRCGFGMLAALGLVGSCSRPPGAEATARITSAVSVPSTPCLLTAAFNAPVPAFTGTTSVDGLSFSADGRTAYVSRKTSTNYEIYTTTRMDLTQPFGPLNPLTSVNSGVDERAPFISQDGQRLYMSKTNGTYLDVAVATWNTMTASFNAPQPIPGLNSTVADQDPFLWNNQKLYFSSERPNGAQREIYVSNYANGTYSPPALVAGVNHPDFEDTRPIVSSDGLTIYIGSTRYGIGADTSGDIFVATRNNTTENFGTPTNVLALNNSGIEFPVALSENGCTLYFASNEETGLGGSQEFRLYQATRGMTNPAQATVNLNIVGFGSVTTPPFNCSTGNVGTCSAQGVAGSSVVVWANQQALWTGSCAPNGGNPSTDGIVVFANGGTCNVSTGQMVRPTVTCVANDHGTLYAVFGYENASAAPVTIPLGASNQITSTAARLPTVFRPGIYPQVVSVPFTSSVTWTIGTQTAVATASSPSCGDLGAGEPSEDNADPEKVEPLMAGVPPTPGGTYVETSSSGAPRAQVDVVPSVPYTGETDETDDAPTLALTHGDRGDRSVEVVIVNNTDVDIFYKRGLAEGAITSQPPAFIRAGSYGTMETRDDGWMQGTGGFLEYFVGGRTDASPVLSVDWNNPFVTDNVYHTSLAGPGNAAFFSERTIGTGANLLATVFFVLRRAEQPSAQCPPGTMQWIIDNLRKMEPPLNLGQTSPAGLLTPLKRSALGVKAWGQTGCRATRVIGTIKHRAWSTDGFYTIDVLLDEFEGALLTGTNKGIRIEVDPIDPVDGSGENPAHQAIQNAGGLTSIEINRKILFNGVVRIDHGRFLEVHPFENFTDAPTCGSPNEPLFCNPIVRNIFTASASRGDSKEVFMGAAQDRACFLITVDGTMLSSPGSVDGGLVMSDIDEATGEWKLTVNAGPNGSLRGQARCVAATGISRVFSWESGALPTPMQPISGGRGCYITRVGGTWVSESSRLQINDFPNPAELSGGPGVFGSARCMDLSGAGGPFWGYILEPAPTARVVMQPLEFGCFYTQIKGPFAYPYMPFPPSGSGSVDMAIQAVNGVPRWSAGVGGLAGGANIMCDILTP